MRRNFEGLAGMAQCGPFPHIHTARGSIIGNDGEGSLMKKTAYQVRRPMISIKFQIIASCLPSLDFVTNYWRWFL